MYISRLHDSYSTSYQIQDVVLVADTVGSSSRFNVMWYVCIIKIRLPTSYFRCHKLVGLVGSWPAIVPLGDSQSGRSFFCTSKRILKSDDRMSSEFAMFYLFESEFGAFLGINMS